MSKQDRAHHQFSQDYVEQLQAELAQCRSRLAARDAELIQLRQDHSKLRHFNKEYHRAYEILQHEHSGLTQELENTTNLSNARGKELAGAQAFLSKADNISVAEVRDLVDALNEEIFQTAASLGDCIIRRKYDLSDEDLQSCTKRLRPIVGNGFLQMLSTQSMTETNERHVNPLLVQVVVQVILVDRCKYEVDRWDPNRPELSDSLKELYRGMRISEAQTVFGRWRALTLAQIKPDLEAWRRDVLKNLDLLLEFACWDTSSRSHLDAFRNRLGTIFKVVQQVRQAIGQDIISEDHTLYVVPPDKPFRTIGMEEAYGDSEKRSSREPVVLGTTALGLMKTIVLPDGPQDSGRCVVLPKVVVDTSFGEILSLQPSSERSLSRSTLGNHRGDGRD